LFSTALHFRWLAKPNLNLNRLKTKRLKTNLVAATVGGSLDGFIGIAVAGTGIAPLAAALRVVAEMGLRNPPSLTEAFKIAYSMDVPHSSSSTTPEPSAWLVNQWVIAGIVSAASRFIPIPFAEEIVRNRCRRYVVSQTLAAHGRNVTPQDIEPYFAGEGATGYAKKALGAPFKLLLFPIRKVVRIVTSVRGVPLEVMRMVLLGRTLNRYLHKEGFAIEERNVRALRQSFDQAFKRMDFHLIRAAMADALSSVSGLKSAAVAMARWTAVTKNADEQGFQTEASVQSGAQKVQAVLDRPETLQLFAEFDRRFDNLIGQVK